MIIGGAHQNKNRYAGKLYPEVRFLDGASCTMDEIFSCRGIAGFHLYIRRWMEEKREDNLAWRLIRENPDIILISDEIGYGLVPVDEFERKYREYTGRVCTELAEYAERVDRVVCGIGQRIK